MPPRRTKRRHVAGHMIGRDGKRASGMAVGLPKRLHLTDDLCDCVVVLQDVQRANRELGARAMRGTSIVRARVGNHVRFFFRTIPMRRGVHSSHLQFLTLPHNLICQTLLLGPRLETIIFHNLWNVRI